ncbi:MAG: DUF4437 domain-containing protein, partial [Cyanobacteria bacterium J06641_5]
PASTNSPKVASLWGNPQEGQLNGSLVKLPSGFTGELRGHGSDFRAVAIQGQPGYHLPRETDVTLEPGSYFGSEGEIAHKVSCPAGEECIIYLRVEGQYDLVPS